MKARDKLIADAKAAGFTVKDSPDGSTLIVREHKRTGQYLLGIRVCQDNTAYRVDVPLVVSLNIRTFKQMRKILGI